MQIKTWPVTGLLMPLIAVGQAPASGPPGGEEPRAMEMAAPLQMNTAGPTAVVRAATIGLSGTVSGASFSGSAGYSEPITFSEFPEGTNVATRYRDRGILFGGTGPTVVTDAASAGGQVLSGGPDLLGDITGAFVLPGTDTPAPVYRLGFDIGHVEGIDSVRLDFFGGADQLLDSYFVPAPGFFRFGQNGGNIGIYRWEATLVGSEPEGYGIDNVYFSTPGVRDDLDREKGEAMPCRGNPVNPAVGNKYQEEVDYEGTRPFPLRVSRTYNSLDGSWRFFPEIEHDGSGVAAQAVRGDGKGLTYLGWGLVGGTELAPSAVNITGDLSVGPDGWQYRTLDDVLEQYDMAGRIVSVTNRAGIRHTYSYGVESITIAHSFGGNIVYHLDLNGRITGFTDPAGETYTYSYTADGMIAGVAYPGDVGGRAYHYENSEHPDLLTGISDANGVRYASWSYDPDRRAISSSHGGGADLTTFDYTGVDNEYPQVTVTNPLGKASTYTYIVANGERLIWQVDGHASDNCVAANRYYGYNGRAFVNLRQDWEGNVTSFVRDREGRELLRTEASGTRQERVIQTSWHPDFNLRTDVVAPGRSTHYSYDGQGNLTHTRVVDTAGTTSD